MEIKASPSTRGLGGWAVLADFSSLLLKASVAGLAVGLAAGGLVLLVAGLGG